MSLFLFEQVRYKHILNISELAITAHKVTCILGPSGSGKTTFLRLLNKMISPDSGSIYFHANELKDIKSVHLRRKVCLLSQEPRIFEGSVRDNLLQGVRYHEKKLPSQETLHQIMHQVQLNKSLEDNCQQFSGGEKQRLALARVLLLNPEVFLLDEPSSSLDDTTEELIIDRITQEAKKKDKTVIMVTHSKQIAQQHADFIIHFSEGNNPRMEQNNHE